MNNFIKAIILGIILVCFSFNIDAQEERNWDNQFYWGNKIAFGKDKWKYSGELQIRTENDFHDLDNWFIESVASYLISESFEIVPDFRFTVKPNKIEFRPGLGLLYKKTTSKIQFVNQIKWQMDIEGNGDIGNAMREVVFLNHRINEKIVSTLVVGFIYRWWPKWNGFQYIRVGPGISYKINEHNVINFSYFTGVENNTKEWLWAGIPMIQLVINITKKYQYTPAYYFSF